MHRPGARQTIEVRNKSGTARIPPLWCWSPLDLIKYTYL